MKNNFRYEGERNSKKKQNIQETVEYILNQEYGSTLTDIELAKILNYNVNDVEDWQRYKNTMTRVKNFLLQYGYVLRSITGVGYYILKPEQIARHCYKSYIKKASKIYDKSAYILKRIDTSNLNEYRLEEINTLQELNNKLIDNVEKTLNESKYYSRKDYYDSLL